MNNTNNKDNIRWPLSSLKNRLHLHTQLYKFRKKLLVGYNTSRLSQGVLKWSKTKFLFSDKHVLRCNMSQKGRNRVSQQTHLNAQLRNMGTVL
jgi:hypothetical protein